MIRGKRLSFATATVMTLLIGVLGSASARAEEGSTEPIRTEPEASADAQPTETQAEPTPPRAPAPVEAPTVISTSPASQPTLAAESTMELRKLPRKLNPIEGQAPPLGYVEVEKRRKGLIISGSVVFGAIYLGCLIGSTAGDRMLAIPLVGPMIAGFNGLDSRDEDFEYDYERREYEDAEYAAKLFGTLGTVAQATGIALFIAGMATKKKIWLRQDIAGVKLLLTPTLVGNNGPGLGVSGTF